MEEIKSFIKKNKKILIISVLILILSCTFLAVGDDWIWGTNEGIVRLKNWFKDYNGRYLSNILIIIISRSDILRIVVTSVITILTIILLKKISNNKKNIYPLIFLLIISMPTKLFINTIAWASGFVNYVLSIFFVLLFLLIIKKIQKKPIEKKSIICNISLTMLGIASTTVVEHITTYCLMLIVFVNIFHIVKHKKVSIPVVFYSIGVILGALIMFSNGAYLNVANGTDFYRSVSTTASPIDRAISTYFDIIYKELIFNNLSVNITIVIALTYLVERKENKKNIKLQTMNFVNLLYMVYSAIKITNQDWNIIGNYTKYLEGIATIIYCANILIITTINKTLSKNQKEKLIFILVSIVLIAGPLLVVKPVTSRCFFPCYIFLILYVIQITKFLKINFKKFNNYICTLAILFYLFWLSINSYNMLNNIRRTAYIKEEIKNGKTNIEIYKLPYEQYIGCDWGSYPWKRGFWQNGYKNYYNIDENVTITMTNKSRKQIEKEG